MRLSIFSRLVIGYTAIFAMMIIMSISVSVQLKKLEDVTHSVIKINKRLSNNKRLMDDLLALVNYEKRFLLLKEDVIYNQFLTAKNDFDRSFRELTAVKDPQQPEKTLSDINEAYRRYQGLFDKEVEFLRAGKDYPHEWYALEKENAVSVIMARLRELRTHTESSNYEKLINLEQAGISARKVIVAVTVFSIICGMVLSVFITRSITKPLSIMRKKTREIASGNYESNLNFSSPQEIDALMHDFNFMCNKLRETDRMKSDFFSLMSHELRTPLTSIKEGTNLLMEDHVGGTNERQKRLLRIISEESDRLLEMINRILDLSKMEAGMMTYDFDQTDIAMLIKKAVLEIEPLARSKNIHGELSISREIPIVKIDAEKMLQVLRNLIGNAIKFTPNGGRVKVSAQSDGNNLEISVKDEGPGIEQENLGTIFDKFKSYRNSKGTGLGLAIVKNVIKAHGGRVWAESAYGQGSTFKIQLPVRSYLR
jgi:two-component system sensor histidine kinase GlrK